MQVRYFRIVMWAFALASVLILSQMPAFAQNASGAISATVTDATGAVVPGAKVVLKNEATNVARDLEANASGFLNFAAVQPGSYTVTASATGMQTWERRGVVMTQGATKTLNITLQVGTTKEEVQVVAETELITPVDSGQASQTLNRRMVEELSIVGRDAAELIKIMPGMGMNNGLGQSMWNSYTTASNTGPIGQFSAAGTQPNGAMTMTSDGANLLDPGNQGTQVANVNQNQVAEVSILTSAYGAEFAKGPVTFQAIGKSGGANFHGSGYTYARHSIFNANDSYNKANGAKAPEDKYYYLGGDIGGPVLIPGTKFNQHKDKLFFYTAYEYMKQQPSGSLINRFIPTEEMMNGNFSPEYIATLGPNFRNTYGAGATTPCSSGTCNGDNAALAGGMIPKTMLDPNSNIYWKTFPKPNVNPAATATGANYQFFLGPPQNRWEYRLRGDYNISENTKLFLSWNHQSEQSQNPISVWWYTGTAMPYPTSQNATQISNVYSANLVHVFSPTLTNETVFSSAAFDNPIHLGDPAVVNPDKLGFKMTGMFKNPYTPQIPNVFTWANAVPGYFAPTYGEPWPAGGKDSFGKISRAPNVSNNLTKIWGTHTTKMGFYYDFQKNNQTGGGYQNSSQGTAEFENYGRNSSGNPLADFAMARITQFFQADAVVADFKYTSYAFYVSDQWKVNRRLSLTYGLRAEHMGNWVAGGGPGLAVWDPSTYDNGPNPKGWTGLQWNAINPSIPKSGFPSRQFFYEPRLGAAYDLTGDGRTVLRGGFGVYRYQFAYNSVSGGAFADPLNTFSAATTWDCCIGWNSFNQFTPLTGTPGIGGGIGGVLKKDDDRTPHTYTFNFTISQRAPWHSVLEVQYQGNRSRDLMLRGGLGQQDLIPMGSFFGKDPITGLTAGRNNDGTLADLHPDNFWKMRNYKGVEVIGHGSYQNYNSLVLTWQKQTGRSTFTTNYTFGKVLGIRDGQTDNGNGNGNTVYPFDIRQNYGVLAYDHTHIFNAAYVINLPNFVSNNKIAGGVVNGWQLSGITQLQSGAPIQPNTNGDLNVQWPGALSVQNYLGTNANGLHTMPMLTCDPRKNLSDGQYFNPSCFAPPVGGQNGSYVWPYIKGPTFFNSDLAVYKNFKFKDQHNIQFRFSAFNFLNHALPTLNAGGNSAVQLNFIGPNNTTAQTNQNALTTGKALFETGRRVIELSVRYNF